LRHDYQQFTARGAEVLAIGPEGQKAMREFWEREGIPFPGLPDPDHTVARGYGQQVKLLKLGRMPALAVVDGQGQIRYRHYGSSMKDIPSNQEVLAILDELAEEGQG